MTTTIEPRELECDALIRGLSHAPASMGEAVDPAAWARQTASLRRDDVTQPALFVGTGTCGLGAGAGKTLAAVNEWLAEKSIEAEVIEVGCIGLCAVEPMLDIQLPGRARVSFGGVMADMVPALLDAMLVNGALPGEEIAIVAQFDVPEGSTVTAWDDTMTMSDHPFFGPQTRWVLANCGKLDPGSMEEYIAHGGYQAFAKVASTMTPVEVCSEVEASGLRGRGGGGFSTGKKWTFALNTAAEQKYLICNADEGDPGAFMDRAVIEGDPYRLLEGLAIAAYGIGASKAYIYIRAEYPLAIKRLEVAIARAREVGLLGHNILDSGFHFDIIIKMGAGAFVCGEETALIHSIEGKRGMPRPRPPFPAVRGLFDKPTIINNVETLSNLPPILDKGAAAYASIGTETSKGTKVFALSGKVVNTGLVEVAMGTKIRDIVFTIGGGVPDGLKFKSVQIGGPSGGCVPEQHLDTEIDYESLKKIGAMMGSGGLVVMDEKTCMVDVAKFFMDFVQRESCGKCIPCREGTRRMLEILERITGGRSGEGKHGALRRFKGVMQLRRLAEAIRDTSLCGLGQSAPNPVLSTLHFFRDEYEAHIFDRHCPAGVCTELLEYTIDTEACIGCTACVKKCPTGAILGAPKSPHYIVPDKCIACGNCVTICRFDAVKVN